MIEEYGVLSALVYDLSKPIGYSIEGDIEYYYEQLKDIHGEILDVGSDTGRLLIPLLKKGLNVTGMEPSNDMRMLCNKYLGRHQVQTTILNCKIEDLKQKQCYEAVVIPSGTFCLFQNPKISLKNIYQSLREEGMLLVDIILPLDFKINEGSINHYNIDESQDIELMSLTTECDWIEQKMTIINKYTLLKDGEIVSIETARMEQYWYGVKEFINMLEAVGFTGIEYVRGYDIDSNSSLITFKGYR